jgi:hypothetical protein
MTRLPSFSYRHPDVWPMQPRIWSKKPKFMAIVFWEFFPKTVVVASSAREVSCEYPPSAAGRDADDQPGRPPPPHCAHLVKKPEFMAVVFWEFFPKTVFVPSST